MTALGQLRARASNAPLARLASVAPFRRGPRFVLTAVGVSIGIVVWWYVLVEIPSGADLHAYYQAHLDVYPSSVASGAGAFLYTPPLLLLVQVLRFIPFDVLFVAWTTFNIGLVIWMAGPWSPVMLMLPPVLLEITGGNIHLLLAAVILASSRWPAAWSFVLLTKISPGVGILWYVVRREWRPLGIALATTTAIAAASFAIAPQLWPQWAEMIVRNLRTPAPGYALTQMSVLVRLVPAALIVIWGARHDARWTLVLAAVIAMPVLWFATLAMVVAAPRALQLDRERRRREAAQAPTMDRTDVARATKPAPGATLAG